VTADTAIVTADTRAVTAVTVGLEREALPLDSGSTTVPVRSTLGDG
jgi:hypothetical protein